MKKLAVLLLSLCMSAAVSAQSQISIVTTIKPLQLIASDLLGDLGSVEALIPAGASPHHYSMKPSDLRKLQQADLAIWVGPELEGFLVKSLKSTDAPVIQLMGGSEHKEDEHEHHEEEEHEAHHHDHGGEDPHVWMDPELMLSASIEITEQLIEQFPDHKLQLQRNQERFARQLKQIDDENRALLQPYKQIGFIVFHDAFGRLIEHYGLNQQAYITVDPARAPGARKLAQIQSLIVDSGVKCVFIEPQFEAAVVRRIVEGLPIRLGQLDPLAIDAQVDAGYAAYLQALTRSIEHCLR